VQVLYDEADEIGTVIDRGLAAHGVGTREVLVSVRLDGEILSMEYYGDAVGGRRLEMVFKKDSVALVAFAFAGVLLSKVGSLEAAIVELKDEQRKRKDEISELQDDTRKLQDNQRKREDAIRNQNDAIRNQNDAIRNQNDAIRNQNDAIRKLQDNQRKREDDTRRLQAANVLNGLGFRASFVKHWLKDFGDFFRLRSTNTTLATSLEVLADNCNNDGYFMRVGQTSLQNFSALRTYYLSREMLEKARKYDSRAVLSAKVWMFREFLKQGLPEVRVPTFPPHLRPHHTTPHHTTPHHTSPQAHAHHVRQLTVHIPTCRISGNTTTCLAKTKSKFSTRWRTS